MHADLPTGTIALLTGGNGSYAMRTSYKTLLSTNYSTPEAADERGNRTP